MRQYQALRNAFRDELFVKDLQGIANDEKVIRRSCCSLAHPGICTTKDQGIVRVCSAVLVGLKQFVLREPKVVTDMRASVPVTTVDELIVMF